MKKIKIKCWIEEEGEKFYGPGPHELLKRIQKEGSLSKAAAQMNMSYKKAWELVQRLNNNSKEPLVSLKKGGAHGGGAELTLHAIEVIAEYEDLIHKLQDLVIQEEKLIKVLK